MSAPAVGLPAQVACVKRELAMRERVYPKQVAAGRMRPEVAEREVAAMRAVLATLEGLADAFRRSAESHDA